MRRTWCIPGRSRLIDLIFSELQAIFVLIVMRTRVFILLLFLTAGAYLFWKSGDDRGGEAREEPVVSQERAREAQPRTVSEAADVALSDRVSEPDGAFEESVPPGTLENEMLVRFRSSEERRRFLEAMAGLDAELAGYIPGLNAVRIRYGDSTVRGRLLGLLPDSAFVGNNYFVLSPTLPPPVVDEGAGAYAGFGDRALRWLGVPEDNSSWGTGVRVAVLDTGTSEHPAFGGKFIPEFNFLEDFPDAISYHGHGTAVASLLAGTNGIAPGADLISLKVLDGDGAGNTFTLAEGIVEAVNQGARVLSMSLGTFGESPILEDAVNYALRHGAVLIAAAGNEGVQGLPYPALYDGVVSVTAVDANNRRAPFSNVAPEVDLAAPGIGLKAAWGVAEEISFSGTSAATPLVAGAVAALLSREPALSPAQAVEILMDNANDAGAPGRNPETGSGVINMDRVLNRDEPGIYDVALADFHLGSGDGGSTVPLQVTVQNRGTESVDDVRLGVSIDGEVREFSLGALERGEVTAAEISLPLDRLQSAEGIEIRSSVAAFGINDSRPENNGKAAILRFVAQDD